MNFRRRKEPFLSEQPGALSYFGKAGNHFFLVVVTAWRWQLLYSHFGRCLSASSTFIFNNGDQNSWDSSPSWTIGFSEEVHLAPCTFQRTKSKRHIRRGWEDFKIITVMKSFSLSDSSRKGLSVTGEMLANLKGDLSTQVLWECLQGFCFPSPQTCEKLGSLCERETCPQKTRPSDRFLWSRHSRIPYDL